MKVVLSQSTLIVSTTSVVTCAVQHWSVTSSAIGSRPDGELECLNSSWILLLLGGEVGTLMLCRQPKKGVASWRIRWRWDL